MKKDPSEQVSRGTGIIDETMIVPVAKIICKTKPAKKVRPTLIAWSRLIPIFLISLSLFLIEELWIKIVIISILFYIYTLADLLDGAFARIQKKTSVYGARVDSGVDIFAEVFVLISAGFYFNKGLIFLALGLMILLSSYIGSKFKTGKRQENFLDYLKKRGLKNRLILFVLLLTRHDMRRLMVIISVGINSYALLSFYFFGVYLLYLIRLMALRYKH